MKKDNSTKLIRSGLKRTEFMETSEPLFLTSGFVTIQLKKLKMHLKNEKKNSCIPGLEIQLYKCVKIN